MARVLFELAALDLLDDVDKQLVGAGLMPTVSLRTRQSQSDTRSRCAGPQPCSGPSTAAGRGEPRPPRHSRRPSSVLRATRSPSPARAIISGGKWSISSSL